MIEPHTRDRTPVDEIQQQGVSRLEDRRIFHSQARQLIDIEEAAIVDFLHRRPPVREPIDLRLQQPVQQVEGGLGTEVTVEELKVGFHVPANGFR